TDLQFDLGDKAIGGLEQVQDAAPKTRKDYRLRLRTRRPVTAAHHLDFVRTVDEPKHAVRTRHVVVDGARIRFSERLRQRQRSERCPTNVGDLEFRFGRVPQREFAMYAGLTALLQGIQIAGDNVGRIQLVLDQADERWR